MGGSSKLHVTLLFLGERSREVWEPAAGAAAGLPTPLLAVKGVRGVPHRRPRLYALDLDDVGGHATDLHNAVSEALGVPVTRPYWPHVTLRRVRRGERSRPPAAPDGLETFAPTALTLYRSHLGGPHGSRYEALDSRALPGRV